jgi:hypothetical protein
MMFTRICKEWRAGLGATDRNDMEKNGREELRVYHRKWSELNAERVRAKPSKTNTRVSIMGE